MKTTKIKEYLMTTASTLQEIVDRLNVTPERYQEVNADAIRIYLDVNGVIIPDLESEEAYNQFPGKKLVVKDIKEPNYYWEADEPFTLKDMPIWFDPEAIERLATLSHDPRVVIVWLTDWRWHAPFSLDEALGMKTLGYLDWQRKFTDYNQVFKGVAIKEEQEASPSKFIWIDDRANRKTYDDLPYFTTQLMEHPWIVDDEDEPESYADREVFKYHGADYRVDIPVERYLSVTTKNTKGLTMKELDLIEEWIDDNYGK